MENRKYALYTFLTLMIELSIASVMYLLVVKLQTSYLFISDALWHYGILKVIWAINSVNQPKMPLSPPMPKFCAMTKSSISETPVTTSELSIGRLTMLSSVLRGRRFIW